MDATTLFSQTLGLGGQWKVIKCEMDVQQRQLRLELNCPAGTKFGCPRCGEILYATRFVATVHLSTLAG
jgi:predicted RNA-binding Zn-ribbon protein involved in translation (DUF1610 family)